MAFINIILITFLLKEIVASKSIADSCGDKVKIHKRWVFLCVANPNQNLDVIFDCGLNPYQNVIINIRGTDYPENMESITIQNCEKITLSLDPWDMKNITQNRLHLLNISLLALTDVQNRCLPQHVIFENIGDINFSMPLISDIQDCEKNGMILESLELTNVTMKNLNSNFIWRNTPRPSSLMRFIMRNVTVENVESDSIFIKNKRCVIEITNSTFGNIGKNFVDGDVSTLAVSGSTFRAFSKENSLRIAADKTSLVGNKIELLADDSLDITSNNIEISDNIFSHIEEKAFRGIRFLNDNSEKSFRFSNNLIYSIAPNSVTAPYQNIHQKTFVDNVTIYNNSVNCDCSNLHWFDSVFRKHDNFYYKWSEKGNLNACLNIPNCDVNQVLKNYEKLCGERYDCSETGNSWNRLQNENFEKIESLLIDMKNYNNETFRNFSRFFENIIDNMEEDRMIFKNVSEFIVDLEKQREKN